MTTRPSWTRRALALAAVVLTVASAALAVGLAVQRFPRGLSVFACIALAGLAAWNAVRRRGTARAALGGAAALMLAGAIVLVIVQGSVLGDALVLGGLALALAAARAAFRVHMPLSPAARPSHPVLLYNPRSGDGKAARFHLADEARSRGIEPIELRPGDDLEQLVRDAVRGGADALAMAGGDGSQAIVARIASELNLPYACIPAGTRNHFALDLGVDRDDVVGALDAFVDGGERRVDLAEVNGRIFVNNVSLGLYAEAVQRAGYREAKIRTLLNTVPDVVGPQAAPPALTWGGKNGHQSGVAVLISNNAYRLGRALSSGTRPRMDEGKLGVTVIVPRDGGGTAPGRRSGAYRQWSAPTFEVDSAGPVPAGIDGEAVTLEPPLRFQTLPGALRVRIAPGHPGASPSVAEPDSPWQTVVALARLAAGRDLTLAGE